MQDTFDRGRYRSPEECVALLNLHAASAAMAAASVSIIGVMLGLIWRVMSS